MSTIQVDRIIPYQSSSVTVEGLSAPNLATTGSNTFVGDQNIQGTITASIAQGFALVGGVGNISTLVATSSFGGGGSGAGFPFTGTAEITGSLTISSSAAVDFTVIGGAVITGSLSVSGSTSIIPPNAPNTPPAGGTAQFIIPFLSGSTFTFVKDQDNALFWSPAFNQLGVSSSAANNSMTPGNFVATNSSANSSTMNPTRISNLPTTGKFIGISGDPSLTNLIGVTTITNPAILLQSGGLDEFGQIQYYTPIQFQSSQSFSDGRVTITRPLIAQQGIQVTGSVTISGSAVNDLVVVGQILSTGSNPVIQTVDNTSAQYMGSAFGGNLGTFNRSNLTEIGIALDGATWTTNWANGPILYVNNTPGDTYEGVFGFQNKTTYTDGRVSVLKPMEVTGSVSLSSTLRLAGQDPLPTGGVGQLAVSASNLYYHNGSSWTQIN